VNKKAKQHREEAREKILSQWWSTTFTTTTILPGQWPYTISSKVQGEVYQSQIKAQNAMKLQPAPRFLSDIFVCDTPLEFLYDPGSQYTMIPTSVYQSLTHKPPLMTVDKVAIEIFWCLLPI